MAPGRGRGGGPRRAGRSRCSAGRPPHIGVLLPNGPEYLFWLNGAALAGAAIVGINPTRRGEALAADVRATDCAMIVTDDEGAGSARGARPRRRRGQGAGHRDGRATRRSWRPVRRAAAAAQALVAGPATSTRTSLYLLIFTSGHDGGAQGGALHAGPAGRDRRGGRPGLRLHVVGRLLLPDAAVPRQRARWRCGGRR